VKFRSCCRIGGAPFDHARRIARTLTLNGHDPYAYFKGVFMRLSTQRASEISELLPHKWAPI